MSPSPIALSIAKGLMREQSNPSLRSGRTEGTCARSRSLKSMNQALIALSIAKGLMREQSNPSLRSGRTDRACVLGAKHADLRVNHVSYLAVFTLVATLTVSPFAEAQLRVGRVVDGGIAVALTEQPGDAVRGRDIATNRQMSLCQLCHQVPGSSDRFQGDVGTSLAGAGARWTVPQLRLRIVDSRRLNKDSVMPAYFKTEGLSRAAGAWRDRPMLDAQQVEDVVAWLSSLK